MKTRLHAEGSAPAPGAVFRALAENSGDCRTRGRPWMEVGTARCAVAARVSAGGPNVVSRALAVVWFRRLTLRSAMGTAQRTVPTWGSAPARAQFSAPSWKTSGTAGREGASGYTRGGCAPGRAAPERRSVTSLQPPLCRAKVLTMASVLLARTSKAGCKPALRLGAYRRFPNLLYRRFPNRQTVRGPGAPVGHTACGLGNPRHSRLGSLRYKKAGCAPQRGK